MRITFVGGGNMAGAMIGGLVGRGFDPAGISAIDPSPEARDRLVQRYSIRALPAATAAVTDCDVLVLAVKPQLMAEVARALVPLAGAPTVLTIAAGVRTADLSRWLSGYSTIVRAMPNTPALVGAGVTGVWASAGVDAVRRQAAGSVLEAMGTVIWVDQEDMLDAVTAVSGSGPAYLFYFLEGLIRAGSELGFEPDVARALACGTVAGAIRLVEAGAEPPEVLRARVTSKGGTTERAIAVLEQRAVGDAIVAAVRAARERARELGETLAGN